MAETYSAGIVTAYGAAVRGGYTGTYEQWCQDMANLGANVAEVRTKAAQAAQSAGNAAGSATAAAGSAGSAAGSASEAASSAGNAAGSATAAAESATAAAGSATNAASSATAASASATAAGNAQTAAETAQGKAEDAQEAAEQAQSDAEAAAQSVSQSAAQIATNTQDIDALKSAVNDPVTGLDTKAPVIIDAASGAIASFEDGADGMPLKKLVVNIEPVQAGSGDPSPDNVRPISGWPGANVTRTGKNLLKQADYFDLHGITYNISDDGTIVLNGTATSTSYISAVIDIQSGTPVTLKAFTPNGLYTGSGRLSFSLRDSNNDGDGWYIINSVDKSNTLVTDRDIVRWQIQIDTGVTFNNFIIKPMAVVGSAEPSAYEQYTGSQRLSISWQSSAGTVYGGTLDVTTGVLTVLMKSMPVTSLSGLYNRRNGDFYAKIIGVSPAAKPALNDETAGDCLCNVAVNMSASNRYTSTLSAVVIRSTGDIELCIAGKTTEEALNEFVSNNNVQIVYELATPQTYQLIPEEVTTLLGQNNIWADCGPSTVEYPADTKLYIQKVNAPADDDMIADAQIASGKYFIIGNNLYLSTTTIPAGDTIIPGTNCTKTDLAAALNALNT